MGQASPFSQSTFTVSSRPKSAKQVTAELKGRLRTRAVRDAQRLTWSVNVGDLSDVELDDVLLVLKQAGYPGMYSRDLGFIAHFEFEWGAPAVEAPLPGASATSTRAST